MSKLYLIESSLIPEASGAMKKSNLAPIRDEEINLAPINVQDYRTLTKDIVSSLRQAIISGQLRPGARLVEPSLAEQLKVSRTPVREAILQLENEGLIKRVPYRGAVVAEISHRDVDEIYAVKSVLEGLAARLASAQVSGEQLKELRLLLKRMEELARKADLHKYTQVSRSFHRRIIELADNRWLLDVYEKLDPPIQGLRILALSLPGRPKDSVREHRAILTAIANGDQTKAQILTQQHVANAGTILRRSFLKRGR